MLRSIGIQSFGESVETVLKKKKVGYGGKDLPLKELGEAKLERLVRG